MKVYFAADHAGFALKEILKPFVESLGYEVEDMGAYTFDINDDYPVFVLPAARAVIKDPDNARAIVIGASGQGEAFAANRIRGVRAVVYYGEPAHTQIDADGRELDMITSTREHNNANVLSLGARFISEADAKIAVQKWLETTFSDSERHTRRHTMIDEVPSDEVGGFDSWNTVKKQTDSLDVQHFFREGDIFFARLGKNIGYEQNGKGVSFLRPVLVIKKFNQHVLFGVSLTTKRKEHPLYVSVGIFNEKENFAILSQCRLFDAKRFEYKIGHISNETLRMVRSHMRNALKL